MKLNKAKRETVRLMFGGRCAYCGVVLDGKWHVDHVEPVQRVSVPVRNASGYGYETTAAGFTKFRCTGELRKPENEAAPNYFPACVHCNILKSAANVEGFRQMLAYFAESIPRIEGYSHVRHLMRFKKLTIDPTPVVFWFEKYLAAEPRRTCTDCMEIDGLPVCTMNCGPAVGVKGGLKL